MTFKLGSLISLAISAATMSAQAPVAVQEIYSRTGIANPEEGTAVVYSFGSWHAGGSDGDIALLPSLFEEMLASTSGTLVEGLTADAAGIEVSWNSVDKLITVKCPPEKQGRTDVLIADLNGTTRGRVTVDESPAAISISNYVAGTYVAAVAVDGRLVKTFKLILK